MNFKKVFPLIIAATSLVLGGCGGSKDPTAPSPSKSEPTPSTQPSTPSQPGGDVRVTGVTLNQSELSLPTASFDTLEATVLPDNATNKAVTWESSDPTIVSIDDSGFYITSAPGEATVTVTTVDGGFTATCHFTVLQDEVKLVALRMEPAELSLQINEEKSVLENVAYVPSNTTDRELIWESLDTNIATVDQNGVIKAISSGTTVITAYSKNDTRKFASLDLNVLDEWVDYVSQATLNHDYVGKTFFEDGIQKLKLLTPIDGDTAHFVPENDEHGTVIKARFFGIDTPESTGKVQPYGKKASNFTKKILKEAKTIVVSSPTDEYEAPTPDSTGSRYVSLVWVSSKENAPYDELQLVNLAVAQAGLCLVKADDGFQIYNSLFENAVNQAKLYKLMMHSGQPDDEFNYSGDYQDVSLLDLKRETEAYLQDKTHKNKYDNVLIRIQGAVVSYSNNTMYIQDYFPNDPDDLSKGGEYAGINIFCGTVVIADKFQARNTYIEVCGLAQDSDTFGFQVTDTQGRWNRSDNPDYINDTDCKVILKAEDNTDEHAIYQFEYSKDEFENIARNQLTENLFCYTKITDKLKVNYFSISDKSMITLGFEGVSFDAYVTFAYYGDPDKPAYRWEKEEDFIGKEFYIEGACAYHTTTSGKIRWQITPSYPSDLVLAE